jgi:hypothetical protein
MRHPAPLVSCSLAVLLCGCATANVLGNAEVRSSKDSSVRGTFEVEQGRLRSGAFQAVVAFDGCVHGTYATDEVLLLCPAAGASKKQEWSGVGGELYTELTADGSSLHLSGFLSRSAIDPPLRRPLAVGGVLISQPLTTPVGQRIRLEADVPLGVGPQWDELRKNPVLLGLAAAVAGVREE